MLKIKTKAPAFELADEKGKKHKLSEYLGKYVLIYFYPKDDTSGCTAEACAISDEFGAFKKLKCVVLGISADSVESHKKFKTKYKLPFTLLSDESKKVLTKYEVWQEKSMYGKKYMGIIRASCLVDPKGKIVKVYPKVKPEIHAEEVLSDLQEFTKAEKAQKTKKKIKK